MSGSATATTLRVATDATTTRHYAEASGDHNPIHTDHEAAVAAGLPGPILHGLYTMAQAARCASLALCDHDRPGRLIAIAVQFRGMGIPERELVVTASALSTDGDCAELDVTVHQDGQRLIRRGRAQVARVPAQRAVSNAS